MATLELVRLRNTMPTGRLTLRYAVPILNPSGDLEALLDLQAAAETTTTPQVAAPASDSVPGLEEPEADEEAGADGETTARKSGQAR